MTSITSNNSNYDPKVDLRYKKEKKQYTAMPSLSTWVLNTQGTTIS
jgi:hypothetical protein